MLTQLTMKIMDQIYTWSRWGLGIIFVYAGATKLIDPRLFAIVKGYRHTGEVFAWKDVDFF